MITFEEAQAIADSYAERTGAVWFDDHGFQITDRPAYWYFPYCFVGSAGLIVCKSTGHVTPLASCYGVDDSFWAYENGFLADVVTLRIFAVHDFERTLSVVADTVKGNFRWRYELYRWVKSQLATLPADFTHQSLALYAPRFRAARASGWFEFELHPDHQ